MKRRTAYTIEVVEERIAFYEKQLQFLTKNNATNQAVSTTEKLLNFWTKYKEKHFN